MNWISYSYLNLQVSVLYGSVGLLPASPAKKVEDNVTENCLPNRRNASKPLIESQITKLISEIYSCEEIWSDFVEGVIALSMLMNEVKVFRFDFWEGAIKSGTGGVVSIETGRRVNFLMRDSQSHRYKLQRMFKTTCKCMRKRCLISFH